MKYDPDVHHRRSIRLDGYDYSQTGCYFVTLCTFNRECQFGEIMNGAMQLNEIGTIAAEEWTKTAEIRNGISLDKWVVMPNHLHGIIAIASPHTSLGDRPVAPTGPAANSLGAIIANYKATVTRRINRLQDEPSEKLWQRNYWDHVIRNDADLTRIREYIVNNPAQWELDKLHPDNQT